MEQSTIARAASANELIPPKDNKRVGREVFKILAEIIQFKADQGLPGKWLRCYELTRNKHWRNPSVKGVPLITTNLLFTHRQKTIAMLTDNDPVFNVTRAGEMPPEEEEMVDIMSHTAEHYWKDTEQQHILEESVSNGETYGVTIEKAHFNPDIEYSLGEVEVEVVDPYQFGWYPVKARPAKAEAMLHFFPMSVREARRRWPDSGAMIVPDKEWVEQLGDERAQVQSPMAAKNQSTWTKIAGAVMQLLNRADDAGDADDDVLIVECWCKDYTRKTEGKQEVDLYPGNIRCIRTCNGGDIVLDDRQNPNINWEALPLDLAAKTYLFDKFPFNVAVSVKDTTNFWGVTDLEHLESMQIEMNKTLSQLTLVKDKASRLKIINPADSGVSNREFTNAPGIINPRNNLVAQAIRYMEPPAISPELGNVFQLYVDMFFKVAGSFEFEQARDSQGQLAYKSIATLLEQVAIQLRGKLRNYQKLIRERGRMYISLAQNWYVEDRWISYDQDGESIVTAIRGQQLIMPAKLGIVSGSTMPVSKIQQREEAIELFKLQAIDAEGLLDNLEFPGAKEIIYRMKYNPIAMLVERLKMLGLDERAEKFMIEIGMMEQKEFDREMKKGTIPPLAAVMQPALPGGEQTNPLDTAEMQVKQAQADKLRMETELVKEKIQTEQVDQWVKQEGVKFDREKLAIERARTVTDIQRTQKEDARAERGDFRETVKTASDMDRADKEAARADQGDIRETVRTAADLDRADADDKRKDKQAAEDGKRQDKKLAIEEVAKTGTKTTDKQGQGPYREKGMKSNNK